MSEKATSTRPNSSRPEAESLRGKVAVVAGASMGFGEQIAARFAREGARLVIAARQPDRLKRVADELGALAVPCDVARSEDLRHVAERALEEFGRLDIAVNSAGHQDRCTIADLEPEGVEKMVAVQFTGALYFIQHMANAMVASQPRGGSIVSISSLTATLVAEGYAAYAGAKAGLNHASRIAASEYGGQGVRVNVVSPTVIRTPMTQAIFERPGGEKAIKAETPLGRIGEIEDVVDAVCFLAGDSSGFITGQNLHVDGGTSLRRLPRPEDFARHREAALAQSD